MTNEASAIITPAQTLPDGSFRVNNLNAGEARMELSNQWLRRPSDQRFLSLNDLRDAVKARADVSFEARVDTRKLELVAPEPERIEDTHKMTVLLPDGREVEPTHWSFGQLAGLAKAPAGYLRTLPSQITAEALTYGLRYNRECDEIKLYAREDQDLRAATGPEYGRIYDHEVVEAVQQVAGNGVGDTRWKVPGVMDWRTMIYNPNVPPSLDTTTLYASDRDIWIFLVDDRNPVVVGKARNGQDDIMFRGFYVANSETGASALKIGTFWLRGLCCNRIMWGVEGFEEISMRHSKYAPARFIEEARPALIEMCERSDTRLIEAVEKAKAAKVAESQESALEFLQKRGFSRKRAVTIMETVEREEGVQPRTVWDMANGITAVARSIPYQDERVDLEKQAKALLEKVAA